MRGFGTGFVEALVALAVIAGLVWLLLFVDGCSTPVDREAQVERCYDERAECYDLAFACFQDPTGPGCDGTRPELLEEDLVVCRQEITACLKQIRTAERERGEAESAFYDPCRGLPCDVYCYLCDQNGENCYSTGVDTCTPSGECTNEGIGCEP